MEPSDWIALVAVVSTAVVGIWNGVTARQREKDRQDHEQEMQQAEFEERRAAEVRREGAERFIEVQKQMTALRPYSPCPYDELTEPDGDLTVNVQRISEIWEIGRTVGSELDWFRISGWTPEIRGAADDLHALWDRVVAPWASAARRWLENREVLPDVSDEREAAKPAWDEFLLATDDFRERLRPS